MQTGTFYAVSAGPGGSDMLTLQAIQVLERCPVICFPETESHGENNHIAFDAVNGALSLSSKKILFFSIPMIRDREKIKKEYEKISSACAEILSEGKDIAFVAIGDVSLYGTASHLADCIEKLGYHVQYVAGVNSFSAAASAANLSLVDRDQCLTVIPADAYYSQGKLQSALCGEGTKVLMKMGRHLEEIIRLIDSLGFLDETLLVQKAGMRVQKIVRGKALLSLDEKMISNAYLSLLIVKTGT